MNQVDLRLCSDFELCLQYLNTNLEEIQVPSRSPARPKNALRLGFLKDNVHDDVDDVSSAEYVSDCGGSSPPDSIFSELLSPFLGPKQDIEEYDFDKFLEEDFDGNAEICTITDVVTVASVHILTSTMRLNYVSV